MASDKRYLEFHGAQWRVQVKVPIPLRRLLGKSKLVEPLHTASLALANKRRWPIVHKFRRMIEDAERQLQNGSSLTGDTLVQEALQWRRQLQDRNADEEYAEFAGGEMVATGRTVVRGYLSDRASAATSHTAIWRMNFLSREATAPSATGCSSTSPISHGRLATMTCRLHREGYGTPQGARRRNLGRRSLPMNC